MFCVIRSFQQLVKRPLKTAFAVAASLLLLSGAASAASPNPVMMTGKYTSQPIGHYEFCKREPQACKPVNSNLRAVNLNQNSWERIINVNANVNNRIKPMTDLEIYNVEEYWAYPTNVGDCEDYVLLKQRELMKSGIPASDLLITVVRKPDGEGHAVLTVRTDMGDYILDNLTDEVRRWDETEYTYLKRQATTNPGRWVAIETQDNPLVGAVH